MKARDNSKLRILVIGAGAVGVYVGGSLMLRGHPVVFLSTPASTQRFQQRGLHLNLQNREIHLPNPKVCPSIKEAINLGPFDLGIFALKAYNTRAVLDYLEPNREMIPPLLCLQNGIENEGILAKALGYEKVIAGTVTSSISKGDKGEVILERLRGVGIASNHFLSSKLYDAFNNAGLNARLFPNADQMKWSKLLTNLLANATSAILDMTPKEIYSHSGLFEVERVQIREALAVMAANDIQPVNLPKTPVRALVFAIEQLPVLLSRRVLQLGMGRGRGNKLPSLYIDLYSGKKQSEVNYLNGAVVRAGQNKDIPTPINAFLTQTLSDLVSGKLPIQTFSGNPEKLITNIYSQSTKLPNPDKI
jgi:2-dehydropantoate 2-reductase